MPKRSHCAVRAAFRALAWASLVLALPGCETTIKTTEKPKFAQSASREELIYRLQRNVQRLGSFRAEADVVAIDQKQLVPKTYQDAVRKQENKSYERVYNKRTLDGYLLLDRSDPQTGPRVRFNAEVPGVGRVIDLLAIRDDFWVKMPNTERTMGDRPYLLYFGKLDPDAPRPTNNFSIRPQDLTDLFLCHELLVSAPFPKGKAVFRETWPDYYILHVVRSDESWPENLYSKIWIERHSLTVAIHQLYDPTGELIGEARFAGYAKFGEDVDAVLVPLQVRFIWPRDRVTLDVRFRRETIKVNYATNEQAWRRPRSHDAQLIEVTSTSSGLKFTPVEPSEPEKKE